MDRIDGIDRIKLGIFPTPLHKLKNISKCANTNVWIKRDDMTGVGFGGNKVRKLEFLLAEAKKQGAEIVLTTGGAQSNHAMLTACCANRLGMKPILVLKDKGVTARKGNLLLEYLMGTEVIFEKTDSYGEIYEKMDSIGRKSGKKYYSIPVGGSNGLGALGYVDCIKEIARQEKDRGVKFTHIICPEGSGGTHAGIALGAKLYMPHVRVIAMKVDTDPFEQITPEIARESAKLLDLDIDIKDDFNHIDCCGSGYAIPSKEGNFAIKLLAEKEGLFLDPVYSGKAFAGLLHLSETRVFKPEDNVIFLYSGGAGGLFAIDVE